MKNIPIIIGAVAIAAASAGAGIAWQQAHTPLRTATAKASMNMPIKSAAPTGVVQDDSGQPVLYWYDPMVPNQRFDKPGKSVYTMCIDTIQAVVCKNRCTRPGLIL